MKNLAKKVIALSLAAAMCTSMAACGGKQEQKAESKAPASQSDADRFKEHQKISIALWGIGDSIVKGKEDAVRDALYKKLNIEIEPVPITWGDYEEKIPLWAASNKLPDMTSYAAAYSKTFNDWVEGGIVRELPKDLSKYPNIQKLMETDEAKLMNNITDANPDAPFYGIPRPNFVDKNQSLLDYGIFLRKDWMEKLGVTKVPTNNDELISLLKKFQDNDPDGNGKKDTIGLTGYTYAWMTALFNGTCPAGMNGFKWVYDKDGSTIVPCWKSEEFLEGMRNMKKVFDAGVMDPDYIILKGEEGRDKFKNGKAGAYAHSGPDLAALKIMEEHFTTVYPDKPLDQILTFVPWFANKEGKIEYAAGNLNWSETYLGSKVDDAKADRCLALIDYLLSDEGYELTSLGIKDVDYKKASDGTVTLVPTKDASGKEIPLGKKYPATGLGFLSNWTSYRSASSPSYSETLKKMRTDYLNEQLAAGAQPANLPNTNGIILENNEDLDTAGGEFAKIINELMTAKDLDAAWKKMVDTNMAKGYDKVIKEENELFKAAGRK